MIDWNLVTSQSIYADLPLEETLTTHEFGVASKGASTPTGVIFSTSWLGTLAVEKGSLPLELQQHQPYCILFIQ